MTKEEIDYRGWLIDVQPHPGEWKALIYRPGSSQAEATFPHYPDRNAVIAEAKLFIDAWSMDPK